MSDDNVVTNTFQERLAAKRREREAAAQANQPTVIQTAPEPPVSVSEDDIPEVDTGLQLSQEEQTIDSAIAGIGIIEAYNRWANKGIVPPSTKTEGIKVSCPNPLHRDEHASAWINTDKNLWNCGGCAMGGDHWDIAAWHYGYEVPGYKDKELFRELRRKISTELGFKEVKGLVGTYLVRDNPAPAEATVPESASVESNVSELPAAIAEESTKEAVQAAKMGPTLDWRSVLEVSTESNTFMHSWMNSTTADTCPEEFHFWTGLMALGCSVGRNRILDDEPLVAPNLFVCLVGPSGTGKSKAKRHLANVLREAVPFDAAMPMPTGTKLISVPGSGEALVDSFAHPINDPTTGKYMGANAPVRGYVDFDEMATLITRANRQGSTLKTTLMLAADTPHDIAITSRMHGESIAFKPFVQIMTTTQNKSLSGLITQGDENAGFVNRWIFVTGQAKPRVLRPKNRVDIATPAAKLKDIWMWARGSEIILDYEPGVEQAASDFLNKYVWPAVDKMDTQDSEILGRLEVFVKKLWLLFTLNEKRNAIPMHVLKMVELMFPYLLATYGVVYRALGSSESQDYQEKIRAAVIRWINKNKTYPSANNIAKSLPPRYRELKLIRDNLRLMVEMGELIEFQPDGGRGRPTVRYGLAI